MNTIIFNKELSPGYFHMGISAPELAGKAKPGQFVMISVRDGRYDPILRRPMGIMFIEKWGIEILYQLVGRGTYIISRMGPGDPIDVIGPFGNGFQLRHDRDIWIIAGGCGLAPFFELVKQLSHKMEKGKKITMFLGARTYPDLPALGLLERFGIKPGIATEDGSAGFHGLVTELVENSLSESHGKDGPLLLASGPFGMLRALADLAVRRGLECFVSIDRRMACGFGVCLGCVVPVKQVSEDAQESGESGAGISYKCACTDGPVFNAREIVW
ncbi:MAG: dihydroorotate dehydrogenase electron transfer subunit [Nitrospinae bacterium]|nr:dihydroorotate dehydrogenase electron transfer subunit [Nitrospinota bacterium]